MTPAMTPIAMAAIGPTKPEAGVMATRQQTAPVAAAIAEGFLFSAHERNAQIKAAAAAAMFVTTNALAARAPAARAEPALKPNQPNHRRTAPRMTNGILLALEPTGEWLSRLPMMRAAASAEKPAGRCTTGPPAKSRAPRARSHPPTPHTQCATGS